MNRILSCVLVTIALGWSGILTGQAEADDYNTSISAPATVTAGVKFTFTVTADETTGSPADDLNPADPACVILDGVLVEALPTIVNTEVVNGKVIFTYECRVYSTGQFSIAFGCSGYSEAQPHRAEATKTITVNP